MAAGEDLDSGMDSPSTDEGTVKKRCIEDEEDEDLIDETLSERLWGLTEMFPNEVRRITWTVVTKTYNSIKCVYSFSRTATWIFFSSSLILFAPVIFEIERANMEEAQRREQKQVLKQNTAFSSVLLSSSVFTHCIILIFVIMITTEVLAGFVAACEARGNIVPTVIYFLLLMVLLGPNAALSGGAGPGLVPSR